MLDKSEGIFLPKFSKKLVQKNKKMQLAKTIDPENVVKIPKKLKQIDGY